MPDVETRPLPDQALSTAETNVLYALSILAPKLRAKGAVVSLADLASHLKLSTKYIGSIICKLKPRGYVEEHAHSGKDFEPRPGRPPKWYSLREDNMVTLPVTAYILRELVRFSADIEQLIDRITFEKHLINNATLRDHSLVTDRINNAIATGYIEAIPAHYIRPTTRISRERHLIERLARRYKPTPHALNQP